MLPTEVIRMPSLRKRLLEFYRNVSIALNAEYVIAWTPYQMVCCIAGIRVDYLVACTIRYRGDCRNGERSLGIFSESTRAADR